MILIGVYDKYVSRNCIDLQSWAHNELPIEDHLVLSRNGKAKTTA